MEADMQEDESVKLPNPLQGASREPGHRSQGAGLSTVSADGPLDSPAECRTEARPVSFSKDSDSAGMVTRPSPYNGPGSIGVKYFTFDKAPDPANFVVYSIPPGAGEGIHTHRLGDSTLGSFDEYYYIVQGSGQMEIDGHTVTIRAGDHVHTPMGVSHGIINTESSGILKVFLTYIRR
jgi:mannose-6-phosphate isomerase-like protein (cupin superfamily)